MPLGSMNPNAFLSATGQINRAKNQQAGVAPAPPPTYDSFCTFRAICPSDEQATDFRCNLSAYGRASAYRGRGRGGYRVAKPAPHRHRTLVLNGASGPANTSNTTHPQSVASPSWVTRNDRHLQLINTNVYQEQTEARAKAMEQTRLQRLQQKEHKERSRLLNHIRQTGYRSAAPTDSTSAPIYEIVVDGIKFAVAKNGSKLVKLPGAPRKLSATNSASAHPCPGDHNAPKATPKVAMVGGVKFHRTKNGNMYRQAIVKAQRYVVPPSDAQLLTRETYRRSGAVPKVNVPCTTFSTTGILLQSLSNLPLPPPLSPSTRQAPALVVLLCVSYIFLETSITNYVNYFAGSCPKGPMCRFVHNHAKVAACKDLLQKGNCAFGYHCDLSHELTPERTPHCVHFAKGNCSKDGCPYTHRSLSPDAQVCRDFGFYGYCDKGISCPDRHTYECPDFSNTGVCKNKRCKLPHRERAHVLRQAAAAREQPAGDADGDDPSSDEDDGDSVGSDEVDSDEVDEFVGADDSADFDLQQDFIGL